MACVGFCVVCAGLRGSSHLELNLDCGPTNCAKLRAVTHAPPPPEPKTCVCQPTRRLFFPTEVGGFVASGGTKEVWDVA